MSTRNVTLFGSDGLVARPQPGGSLKRFLTVLLLPIAASTMLRGMSASLEPSTPSPAAVGTRLTWSAAAPDAGSENVWYRFRERRPGESFRVIRDFSPANQLDWTAAENEGIYEVEVSARNNDTGEIQKVVQLYEMTSRVTDGSPVITPTTHPLVWLYSAPSCAPGSRMRVLFQGADGFVQATPYKPCRAGVSMNFYLAGLRAVEQYSVRHVIETEGAANLDGPEMSLTTPEMMVDVAARSVIQPPVGAGVLLNGLVFSTPIATDLNGNLIWYYPEVVSFLTRPQNGGTFFLINWAPNKDRTQQIVREIDLTGMTLLETNAARINEQLAEMGKRPIGGFHHEARRLPDGRILVLASVEQILTDVQGDGNVDVVGDMILILDSDLQVVWTWDAFDHLDAGRRAVLGEGCNAALAGCPPMYLAKQGTDWLHGNSVQRTPDGHLLFSSRHQDWVIKIDYADGKGSGAVIWRLGKDGDFAIDSSDAYPWFSHQHDPQVDPDNPSRIILFDNGNTRHGLNPEANSRGQVYELDEQNRVARIVLNADLGSYSFALGAAQRLASGNYHFGNGWYPDVSSRAIEVDPAGNTVYSLRTEAPAYRSFRMPDLYTAPR